jgi:hypothetical protein
MPLLKEPEQPLVGLWFRGKLPDGDGLATFGTVIAQISTDVFLVEIIQLDGDWPLENEHPPLVIVARRLVRLTDMFAWHFYRRFQEARVASFRD